MSATVPTKSKPFPQTPDRLLQRLDWQVIRPLDGLLQGQYRTLFYGTGIDFTDLREYQVYDDIRHIDWNVTARVNSPYVRQFVEDREITAWFLLDLSPSMEFGPRTRSKKEVLVNFTATMARLLTQKGNRVGAVLFNNKIVRTIPPKSGRNQVLRIIRHLLDDVDDSTGSSTDLSVLLRAALNMLKSRSHLFLISDFYSEPGWERPMNLLNQKHEMVAVRLWDPLEIEIPEGGLIIVEDAETNEQLNVDTSNPEFRRRFRQAADRLEETLKKSFKRAGVDLFTISTEEDLLGAIIRMAAHRKKRRK